MVAPLELQAEKMGDAEQQAGLCRDSPHETKVLDCLRRQTPLPEASALGGEQKKRWGFFQKLSRAWCRNADPSTSPAHALQILGSRFRRVSRDVARYERPL